MHSELLQKNGLINLVGGIDYNFRATTAGETFVEDVDRLIKKAEIEPEVVYTGRQVHGKKVAYASGTNGEAYQIGRHFDETDGLITDKVGVALLIKYADCTPIILFDPVKKVQASVHSGWRGTVQKIGKEAIDKMVYEFGSRREDILAYIGPSIAQEHYEVGPEVYEAFSKESDRYLYFKEKGTKYLLDMAEANVQLLLKSGISPKNMEIEQTKTYTSELLHSARKEGLNYRLNGIITIMK